MSLSYWMIEGIGLCANDIGPHLDNEKVVKCISEVHPDDLELKTMILRDDYSNFDVHDYIDNGLFENVGDLLCFCDDTDSLTFCNDGDGNTYFYYPPSMPWERSESDPKNEEEVIQRIISAVKGLTDLQDYEIREMIDRELCVVGAG